jgi:transposase
MPSAHRRYRDWTHERIRHEAKTVGPDVAVLIDVILRSRPHPEQGFRSCVGILRLVKLGIPAIIAFSRSISAAPQSDRGGRK